MHLNPQHPNILHDMQAAANGRDLRDGKRITHMVGLIPTGRLAVLPTAKRHLIPRKSYPYASERQVKRQQRRYTKMATVSKDIADKIKDADGYYSDDPRVFRIVEYTDMNGKQAFGLEYEHKVGKYAESVYIRNPKVYYQAETQG